MRKGVLFGLLSGGALLLAAAAVGAAALRDQGRAAPASSVTLAGKRGYVLFRDLDRSRAGRFGTVALVRPGGTRLLTGLRCERVYAAAGRGICLAPSRRFGAPYAAVLFGRDFRPLKEIPLGGAPSRARVSADGRYGAVTSFVTGHSYASAGTFSTQTLLIDMVAGRKLADLESFAVTHEGRPLRDADFNFWGVTYRAGTDRFYATLATGGKTFLVEGDVSERRVRTLRENVECPSLSPDGTRVAYKKLVGRDPAVWRLHVLDLGTMKDRQLAETRVIDDQAEWLDDGRVLYRVGEETWVVRADGRGQPRRFLARADSPAVLR